MKQIYEESVLSVLSVDEYPRLTKILTEQFPSSGLARLGVMADTHIPDRLRALPPRLFDVLRGVDLILHAGDICHPRVLAELRALAPVVAVRGNRDVFYRAHWTLPLDRIIEIGGVRLGLTHGHGGLWGYVGEKLLYYTVGFRLARFNAAVRTRFNFTGVQVIVFGHSHVPVNARRDGVLMFNPGSVGPEYGTRLGATVGILTISGNTASGVIVRC